VSGLTGTINSATRRCICACLPYTTLFRSFTAKDGCNNAATTAATFTIADTSAPSIATPASGSTVECDGSGNTSAYATWLSTHGGAAAGDTCARGRSWSRNPATASWQTDCG